MLPAALSCSQQVVGAQLSLTSNSHSAVKFFGPTPAVFDRRPCVPHQCRVRVVSSLEPSKGKGFGKKNVVVKRKPAESDGPAQVDVGRKSSEAQESSVDDYDGVPEVVTNRMLKRILLTVGVPVAVGVLFFPLFYYLKVMKKVDVPEWLPLLASMFTFGAAGLGITYGVVSSSWDPSREGSMLGWKEAQANWPVFWQTVQGKQGKK